ncbi:MAG: type II and III secretion system protein [Planctomycetes bacterium]|nr:type II and III secretion system protein [Planctomycetota bacterium]
MNSTQKISFSLKLIKALAIGVGLWIGGCGDFLTDKSAGRESNNILDDLGRVETFTEPNIPFPSIYKEPPKIVEQIVGGAPEFKLFYFCRHLSAAELEAIVHKQFATILTNAKAKSTTVKDYTVSSIAITNQLIVRCPTREDVEAVLETLQHVDIQPIQVKINCLISEVYADKTLDWETTVSIENLLGESISAMPSARPFGRDVVQWLLENDPIATFPGASLREFGRAKMGLNVGYLSKDHKFLALIDILESHGYLKILMNPTLETVNGKPAKISSSQRVPVDRTTFQDTRSDFFTVSTQWVDIVDSLEITPHVFADGYIGLETEIVIGSKLTPEGIKQLPIVTTKKITNKENRIRPGESLIIGGLRKSEKRDVLRGFPFLKDIPLLGMLFSGRDFEERAVETIFILTPSISTGGIPREEMTEEVERKRNPSSSGGIHNPLDMLEGKREKERKTKDAEKARTEAEAEKAEARAAVRDAVEQIERAKTEAEKAKAGAKTATEKTAAVEQQAKAETATAKAEVATAKADTAKAKADTAKAQTDAKTATEKAAATMKQAQTQIEKLQAETEKLKAETEKVKADLQKATAEAEKAKADAEKAAAEAVKAKADAEKAAAEAAKAKADAEKAKTEAEAKAKKEAAEEAKKETEQAKTEKPEQEGDSKEQS